MTRRLLPFLLLALAFALPAAAGAAVKVAPQGTPDRAMSPERALSKAEAAAAGRQVRGVDDLTPLLRQIAVAQPDLSRHDRKRARRVLSRPTGSGGSAAGNYTVAEHKPLCSAHFCIHFVTSTADRPPLADSDLDGFPNYVETTSAIFEHVYQVENAQMGWRLPKSDGTRGCFPTTACVNKTDVYLQDVGSQDLYGQTISDGGQDTISQFAYLVVDNDFTDPAFEQYTNPIEPLEVTAAHEYNHVLQYAYDIELNTWMYEATAVWMEEKVYTDVNDYLQYLGSWSQLNSLPLTNERGANDEFTGKTYGDVVWPRWLERAFGDSSVLAAWQNATKTSPQSFPVGAFDLSLRARGSGFYRAFTRFAADTAEWRASNSAFIEGSSFPNVQRAVNGSFNLIHLKPQGFAVGARLSHTGYDLFDVRPSGKRKIKLVVSVRSGPRFALALVGRTGSQTGGTAKVALKRLSRGGTGTVTLPSATQYSRVTAAIVNGDGRTTGFRFDDGEWEWRADRVPYSAWISSDFKPPSIKHRSPGAGKRGVSRRAPVKVRFSERVRHVTSRTAILVGPGGHKVKAKVTLRGHGRSLTIRPRARLRSRKRYTVRLSSSIQDRGANRLAAATRSWTFRTRR